MPLTSFASAGFEVIATGGGCSAWYKPLNDKGAHVLITGLDGCSHELAEGSADKWLIGAHWETAEGEAAWSECLDAETVDGALKAAEAIALAHGFARALAEDIGTEKVAEAVERNETPKYKDSGSCASHDFCDANMTMLRAWEELFGSEPAFISDSEETESLDLMNRAWTFARTNHFFTKSAW